MSDEVTAEEGTFLAVLQDIAYEMGSQDARWGRQDHAPLYWLGIMIEEVGELGKSLIEGETPARWRAEAVQVAAVAAQFIAALDRGKE